MTGEGALPKLDMEALQSLIENAKNTRCGAGGGGEGRGCGCPAPWGPRAPIVGSHRAGGGAD
jgi:hypothetical protein